MALMFVSMFAQASSSTISKFVNHLKTSEKEPGWILAELIDMNVEDFCVAFEELSNMLKNYPWIYVHIEEKQFSELEHRATFLTHCKAYERCLQETYVIVKTGKLIYPVTDSLNKSDSECMPLIKYLKTKKYAPLYDFFGFYFKYASAAYLQAIQNAFLDRDIEEDYRAYLQKSDCAVRELTSLLAMLKGSPYELRASAFCKRYQEIRKLLEETHAREKQQ